MKEPNLKYAKRIGSPKRKFDLEMPSRYIVAEIHRNSNARSISVIKRLLPLGSVDIVYTMLAYFIWADKVLPRHEWDHKPKLRDLEIVYKDTGADGDIDYWSDDNLTRRRYSYQIWSN